MFIYGGYILTGGTLDNGKSWRGINVMLADRKVGEDFPFFATVCKGLYSDSLLKACQDISIGTPVSPSFVPSGTDKNSNPVYKLNELKRLKP